MRRENATRTPPTLSESKRRWLNTLAPDDDPEKTWDLDDACISVVPPDFEPESRDGPAPRSNPLRRWLTALFARTSRLICL